MAEEDVLAGIDLGTTNSALAIVHPDRPPEVLPNAESQRLTPSVVQISADGTTLVGELAKREVVLEKENTAQFFKREMGTSTVYEYRGRTWTPTDLSAEVLKKLKLDAEAFLRKPVRRAVVTVPAYFQDAARVATRQAGEQAGLEVIQIINEPTAAALAYGLKQRPLEEVILVYDLGGGTFDITLVRVGPAGVQVIGTDGDHHLGGKNWDDRLVEHIADQFRRRHGVDPLDEPYTYQELLIRAEDAKKTLSASLKVAVPVQCQGKLDRIEVTREQFDSLTRDLLARTEMLMHKVLEETGYEYSRVSSVLMVGGSTRMPACLELVRRLTGRAPNTTVNPDECVAIGAAIQAALYQDPQQRTPAAGLAWRGPIQIEDVTSHSLGMIAVSADGKRYVNSVLIPKNRPIRCREVRPYQARTARGKDNTVSVYVNQGEGEDPANCSFVGKYVIKDIPHGTQGMAVLDIAYEHDRSGVVSVSATERSQKRSLPVEKQAELGDTSWVLRSPEEVREVGHKTIYAAIDLSGSMIGQPLAEAQNAVRGFIQSIDLAHSSVGLFSFADKVHLDQEATQNAKSLERAIAAWRCGSVGYGNATDPFQEALGHLRNAEGARYIIVLTDGVWSHQDVAARRAKACREAGIEIIAIGFGGADRAFLRRLTTADEAALYVKSGELVSTFGQIAQVLVEGGLGRAAAGDAAGRRK